MSERGIEFDKNGVPYPVVRDPVTPVKLMTLLCSALSVEYECRRDSNGDIYPDELKYEGLSKAEVGALKAADGYANGDLDHTKFVHDRIIGKPKQQIESMNVSIGIKDYLKVLEDREKAEQNGQPMIEAATTVEAVEVQTLVPTERIYFTLEDI